jgi:hypothetical protein
VQRGARRSAALVAALAALFAGPAPARDEAPPDRRYSVLYDARIVPTQRAARVAIRVRNEAGLLRTVRLAIDPERHLDFSGDGSIVVEGNTVEWRPTQGAATLRYVFRIDHLRDERSYDARCAEKWAIFRGDDLVPPARVRTLKGARAEARLRMRVPDGWSVALPWPQEADGSYRIDNPRRRFDRPTGWMVAGRLGVRREKVAGVRLTIAGPVGQHVRRMDLLALLRWTLPELRDAAGELPERLLVAGAGDPMWRGGLSGPASLFLHASRPLIEEDGSSPVLHELVHSVARISAGRGGDWVVEGLAELYSLELLVRSRTVSRRRHEKSLARLEEHGRSVRRLEVDRASGAVTARAVTVLHALDLELRSKTDGAKSLDDVFRSVVSEGGAMTSERFRRIAEESTGVALEEFFERHVAPPPRRSPSASRPIPPDGPVEWERAEPTP